MTTAMQTTFSEPARLTVRDPARGTVIEELAIDDSDAVVAAAKRAREALPAWAVLTVRERGKILKKARRALVAARADIFSLLERETGKARFDVVGELMGACMGIGYLVRRAPRWLRTQSASTKPLFGKRGKIVFKPHGVVGIISPWNAPLNLFLDDCVPALLAGNVVLSKPSEITPLAVQRAAQVMNQVLPKGVLQVLIGAGETGAAVVDQVDMVCVTGSPETGKRVMERASRRLTPVLLELGGKDPMIVLRDADLDRAARAAAWGGCMMSGQVCMSVERIYVEEPVAEEFSRKLTDEVGRLRVGPNGDNAEIDYGAFTSPKQIDIVEKHVADAVARGAKILTGGHRRDEQGGHYFEPTVLADVDHSMQIMTEETFGPILPIMKVADAEEALRLANDSRYGLNASVWTRDLDRGFELATRIESGNACVNECLLSAGIPELPFGGVKQSGVGTRHGGADGLRQFCVRQAILIEPRRRRKTEAAWFPYSIKRAAMIDRLIGLMFRW